MIKNLEKLNELKQNIINNMLDNAKDASCIVFNIETIEAAVEDLFSYEQINNSLKKDMGYKLLDTDEQREKYLDDNFGTRYFELTGEPITYIYNQIIKDMQEKKYDVYEGDFFPYNGSFQSLFAEQIAFVK